MESGTDVLNDNLPKYKPSFANRKDSFPAILIFKSVLSISCNSMSLFYYTITLFSDIIKHIRLFQKFYHSFPVFGNQATFQFAVLLRDFRF